MNNTRKGPGIHKTTQGFTHSRSEFVDVQISKGAKNSVRTTKVTKNDRILSST